MHKSEPGFKMTAVIYTILILGVVVITTAGQLTEDTAITQARRCDCKATVYEHANYGGRSLVIIDQNSDFKNSFFNDKVDSIKISGTCRFLFYEHTDFNTHNDGWMTARTHLLRPGNYPTPQSWGGRGNMISSARALPPKGTKAIAVFEHPYYCGAMIVLYGSHSFLPYIHFDDKISSEIVLRGSWSLFDHGHFTGVSVTRTTGYYPWEHNLMDRITSIRKNY